MAERGWGKGCNSISRFNHFWDEEGKGHCKETEFSCYFGKKISYIQIPIEELCPECNNYVTRGKDTRRYWRPENLSLEEFRKLLDIYVFPYNEEVMGETSREELMSETIRKAADPNAPTVTNEKGGGQSHIPVRFDLIDAKAMFEVAAVLHEGAEKYGADNWRLIDIEDHLNHLLTHVYAYLAGDRSDDHLSHAACRAIFALANELEREDDPQIYGLEPLENPTLHNTQPVLVNSRWYDRDGNWEIVVTGVYEHAGKTFVEWISGILDLSDFLYEFYQPPKYGSVWRNDRGHQVMVSGHEVKDGQLATIYTLNELFTADDFFERYEKVIIEVKDKARLKENYIAQRAAVVSVEGWD